MYPQRPIKTVNVKKYNRPNTVTKNEKPKKVIQKEEPEKRYQSLTNEELINSAFQVFKNFYGQRVAKTTINAIVNGEIIKTSSENIFTNSNINWKNRNKTEFYDETEEFIEFKDDKFENKLKLINKTLYDYQIEAIKKLRELELNGKYVCESTGETIRSNGWLLHLPIGAGKSLVFLFMALFYRNIPPYPIIISTSGKNIPDHEMTQPKIYPFYYENVGYVEGKENCAIEHYDYNQRPMTVLITHDHLMDQVADYLREDFHPKFLEKTKIKFVNSSRDFDLNVDLLVVPAKLENINRLVQLSYEKPFMRVIIDDYTNMNNVDDYRQILATSTIFVSGSGFERDKNRIPPSYYTLRHVEVDKISVVAPVEKTQKGILRNSILTLNINSSETEFSSYQHIQNLEDYCGSKYNLPPSVIYSSIEKNGQKIKDYLGLTFLINNIDRLGNAINNVEKDLQSGKLNQERVSHYIKWRDEGISKMVKEYYRESKEGEIKSREIENPFYKDLLSRSSISSSTEPILHQKCQVCENNFESCNNGWGFISTCCGSFFCYQCAKQMVTNKILNTSTREFITSDDYYCVVCHKKHPTFFTNCVRSKSNSNVQSYSLVDLFMDTEELNNSAHFDYFFKMLLDGFTPKYFDGRIIEIDETNFENGEIIQLFPKDQLAINSIKLIDNSLKQLEIKPAELNKTKPCILFYGCPQYIQQKMKQYFKTFSTNRTSSLYNLEIEFKNSMNSLIGLHQNILGIVVWNEPANKDEIHQLIGRILRLNVWNNPLYFYINYKSSYNIETKEKEIREENQTPIYSSSSSEDEEESENEEVVEEEVPKDEEDLTKILEENKEFNDLIEKIVEQKIQERLNKTENNEEELKVVENEEVKITEDEKEEIKNPIKIQKIIESSSSSDDF